MKPKSAMTFLLTCYLLVGFCVLPPGFANPSETGTTSSFDQLRAEHQQVLDDLNGQGHPLDLGDPRVAKILKRGWALAGEWAAAYFEAHPSPSDLERVFDGFAPQPHGVKSKYGDFLEYHDYSFEGSATRLGPATYIVRGRYWMDSATDGFFVVARGADSHFHALWSIKDLAEKHYAQRDEIGRWVFWVRRAYYNGPLAIAKILPLPPAANGYPRFLVDAFQSAEGGTALAQLSIWEWDGVQATPLLVDGYQYARGYADLQFHNPLLRIATKEETGTLFACGMCPEPKGLWTIRISPEGVQDLGHRFVDPEIQWADELLTRMAKGKNTDDLATGDVVTAINGQIKKEKADFVAAGLSPNDFSWGLLDGYNIIKRGQEGVFEVDTDQGNLRFSYVMRNDKPYFTNLEIH